MSDYQEYLSERDKIDYYLSQGYKITSVTENLSGAFLTFRNHKNQNDSAEMHVKTADARKYFSAMLLAQIRK
ncbi:hypothetical protein M4D55_01990 [Metabacillus idriensis]|uniref:Uncharacterized protein n=1 Tax=Metabacillus idriensis TaxID=324768 RepID=A0A6I2MAE5_9BACI|nr:hypothetical protein [Metabacillus idriensis]MCM3594559.1 hypothetical protein [Metabacillus idriensis]MRX53411.1 hypothetical protein [Metabacillus idriensis]OHR73119.1 hypothetical protein HMPREF3291_20470 [Bacillus sp. HMSC76G11]